MPVYVVFVVFFCVFLWLPPISALEQTGFSADFRLQFLTVFFFCTARPGGWLRLVWLPSAAAFYSVYLCTGQPVCLAHVAANLGLICYFWLSFDRNYTSSAYSSGYLSGVIFWLFVSVFILGAYWAAHSAVGWGWDVIELCPFIFLTYCLGLSHAGPRVRLSPTGPLVAFLLFTLVRSGFYSSVHHISFFDFQSFFCDFPVNFGILDLTETAYFFLYFFLFMSLRCGWLRFLVFTPAVVSLDKGRFGRQYNHTSLAWYLHLRFVVVLIFFLSFPHVHSHELFFCVDFVSLLSRVMGPVSAISIFILPHLGAARSAPLTTRPL